MDKVEVQNLDTIEKTLELIHTPGLINRVKDASEKLEVGESTYTLNEADNYENKHTYDAAKVSAAATVTGVI